MSIKELIDSVLDTAHEDFEQELAQLGIVDSITYSELTGYLVIAETLRVDQLMLQRDADALLCLCDNAGLPGVRPLYETLAADRREKLWSYVEFFVRAHRDGWD